MKNSTSLLEGIPSNIIIFRKNQPINNRHSCIESNHALLLYKLTKPPINIRRLEMYEITDNHDPPVTITHLSIQGNPIQVTFYISNSHDNPIFTTGIFVVFLTRLNDQSTNGA